MIPGATFEDRYRIESVLGTGGFSDVYRAFDLKLRRPVALKIIKDVHFDPNILELFEAEAQKLAKLRHPHIVQIFDVGKANGRPYLVEEYVQGQTLRAILDAAPAAKGLSASRSLSYVSQLLDGLFHAHTQSSPIVHLDIKPNNLIVDDKDRLTIVDFGIAHVIGSTPTEKTAYDRVIGTLPYMSPEQLGKGRVDARSDIYSAAVVLFELLTRKTPIELRNKATEINAALPPNRELRDIVLRGLENDPSKRFTDALQMKAAVDAIATKLIQPRTADAKQTAKRPKTRFVQQDAFSKLLLERLEDSTTKTIQMICYTGEVDSGLLSKYRISPQLHVEVFKRSVLADLADQQDANLRRLAEGRLPKIPWNKRKGSMQTSDLLRAQAQEHGKRVSQYLYEGPPSWRAYIFDRSEAVISYYEVSQDPVEGAPFKGLKPGRALTVNADGQIGKLILDGLLNYIEGLRLTSHDWDSEKRILEGGADYISRRHSPCTTPRVALLDLDGTLYDSLPYYVKAWKAAFGNEGVDIDESEIYAQEGRPGKDTVKRHLMKCGLKVDDQLVDRILGTKNETLQSLGDPPVMKGAKQLVESIKSSGLDMWVVTGSGQADVGRRIEADFGHLLFKDHLISGVDVRTGKPHPEPYLAACSKAGLFPHQAVAIENAPLGLESAARAGVYCLAVNTGILSNDVLYSAGARAVFSDCAHLASCWSTVVKLLRD
jgi:serine/threonine protein kinase/beta-phosphoglucomutase-like phosphatase (HAD superfamily)